MRGNSMRPFVLPDNFEFKEGSLSHVKRCFILGNGPTLNKFILDQLSDEFTIGTNRILYSGFTPTILGISDPVIISNEYIQTLQTTKSKLIFAHHVAQRAVSKFNFPEKKISKIFNLTIDYEILYGKTFPALYYKDFSQSHCIGAVIAEIAIPLALFLGIKEIYILGLDEYWNINNMESMHFFNDNSSKDLFRAWATGTKMRDTRFAKIDILAGQKGCNIYNLSPGSAILAFKKLDANDIFPHIINKTPVNCLGDFIEYENEMYKIVQPNSNIDGQISLKNIKNGRYIRHFRGNIIPSDGTLNSSHFNNDSSFYAEQSFVDKNKVSFKCSNIRNAYIVKDAHESKYKIRNFSSDFIAQDSSFTIFKCE